MKQVEESREELQQKVAQNRELMTQLTKKNDQFVFDINKILADSNLPEEKKVVEMNTILNALVEGQKTGATAKQLYGTPTEAADLIIKGVSEAINSKHVTYDFARMMDNAVEISCSGFGNKIIECM